MTNDRMRLPVALGYVAGAQASDRVAIARQREVAMICRAHLRAQRPQFGAQLGEHEMSVSHSRAWIAVGALPGGTTKLGAEIGVDVEYAEPARDWARIISYLTSVPKQAVSPRLGALVWTSYEAVFKATGVWPAPDQIADFVRACAAIPPPNGVIEHGCGDVCIHSLMLPQDGDFALSVALRPPAEQPFEVVVELVPPSAR